MTQETESHRFFKDELDSSQDNSTPLDFSLDSKDSILFGNTQAKSDITVDEIPRQNVQPSNSAVSINKSGNSLNAEHSNINQPSSQQIFIDSIKDVFPDLDDDTGFDLYNRFHSVDNSHNNAIEYYFDNLQSQKNPDTDLPKHQSIEEISHHNLLSSSQSNYRESSTPKRKKSYGFRENKKSKGISDWRKFIGSLQLNAMATRPTTKPLKYGTSLKFVKNQPNVSAARLYNSSSKSKTSLASFLKVYDVQSNREVGKIPEDFSQILFTLIDSDGIDFDMTLIFCDDKRLSIGDTFILQLDCFLTSTMFKEMDNSQSDNVNSGNDWEISRQALVESSDELENKARRRALLILFDKLDMYSVADEETAIQEHRNSQEQEIDVIDLESGSTTDDIFSVKSSNPNDSQNQDESLDFNQLKAFYNSVQSRNYLKNMSETEPPQENFKLSLRKYQKQGLTWMLKREQELGLISGLEDSNDDESELINPLWKQFKWPKDMSWEHQRLDSQSTVIDNQLFFFANLHTGNFSLSKPVLKSSLKGGILADEMGLGKTISTYALILTAPFDSEVINSENSKINEKCEQFSTLYFNKNPYAAKTTLIIVPMSLLTQWHDEFRKANNSANYYCEIYYGGNVSSLKTLLTKNKRPPTVVLTTYGIVQNEWTKMLKKNPSQVVTDSTSGLFSVEYFRIVLDEGHTIRNRNTITSKAIMNLSSRRKWVLTGTPIINRLDDLYSLVNFLNLEPWSQISYWKGFVSNPFESRNFKEAFDVVNAILEPVLLRRTKQMKCDDGKPLVELPKKEIRIEKLTLNNDQEIVYKYFLDTAESTVRKGLAQGDLLKKYSTILVHILRLRQACCDIDLLGSIDDNDEDLLGRNAILANSNDLVSIIQKFKTSSGVKNFNTEDIKNISDKIEKKYLENRKFTLNECPICTTEPISPSDVVFTECLHTFCKTCLMGYFEFQKQKELQIRCPNCREKINPSFLFVLEQDKERKQCVVPYNSVKKPVKLEALIKHLKMLHDKSAGEQVVVFSQFSSYLDILERELMSEFSSNDVCVYKFDGRLSLKERSSVLKEFGTKDLAKQKILLLSLKAGGVGLNLTCASHAFMMDPWWSPSMEDQAIDRIHRIGQINNVKVIRFIIQDSIEEKMLLIQERKRTIGEAMDTDEDTRRKRRIEEIQMLFE